MCVCAPSMFQALRLPFFFKKHLHLMGPSHCAFSDDPKLNIMTKVPSYYLLQNFFRSPSDCQMLFTT